MGAAYRRQAVSHYEPLPAASFISGLCQGAELEGDWGCHQAAGLEGARRPRGENHHPGENSHPSSSPLASIPPSTTDSVGFVLLLSLYLSHPGRVRIGFGGRAGVGRISLAVAGISSGAAARFRTGVSEADAVDFQKILCSPANPLLRALRRLDRRGG